MIPLCQLLGLLSFAFFWLTPASSHHVASGAFPPDHGKAFVDMLVAPETWRYEEKSDNITGNIYKATVNASKSVEFPYPYAGGSTVSLVIRNRGGSTNIYLATTKGMFTRSFQGGKAQISFDNGRPVTYFLTAAANGSGNTVYFDKEKKLIQQIKASKSMTVQLQFTGFPLEALQFNSAGLRWNH